SIPKDININFVDKFYLNQTFEMDSLGIRQLKNEDVSGVFKIFDGMQGVYARRNSNYYNHDYAESASPEIFSSLSNTITPEIAYERTDNYWQENRPVELSDAENRVGEMITRLRKNKTYHWLETITKIIVDGYIPTASPDSKSKFNIGPWNTTISGNEIEGIRLRVGGLTTAALSKRIFARGYIAYGTKDHRFKYSAELEYSFRNKQKHAKEFPMHSIALSQEYDVDKLGQHYLFTSSYNIVLSVTRIKNKLMTYLSTTKLEYTLELENNFSVVASLNRQRQSVGPYLPFVTSNGVSHNHFDVSSFMIQLRYAPGEKFYQTNSERIPLSQDAPIILISHQYGPDGYFGNNFGINKTEVSFHKRFWLSAFGYIDGIVKGGWIWNQVPYPLLLMPNANLSYTIQ
ncbi:MAG: carboxypeptidase-like regulatory domain-containing protein, partial [Muribaculaceae bacterium]|nr:carboxypeptidase-like regulatory domain-containing protein [Muribaculaceae bacterium]